MSARLSRWTVFAVLVVGLGGLFFLPHPPSALVQPEARAQGARPKAGDRIPGQYIVVLKDQVTDPKGEARGMGKKGGFAPRHIYTHALKGFSARLTQAQLANVLADPRVQYAEQDQVVTA